MPQAGAVPESGEQQRSCKGWAALLRAVGSEAAKKGSLCGGDGAAKEERQCCGRWASELQRKGMLLQMSCVCRCHDFSLRWSCDVTIV
jgi:hypothetical protein